MGVPTIYFNTSTGSDTQASGAGPATAVFGTNASFSGSVWTLDGSPDLSGVLTDGTHVLWAQTSTGRQFFTINAVDNGAKTVTTDDAPSGTATGRTWAIGGKRNTFNDANSRTVFGSTGVKDLWTVITETNQTITTTAITCSGNARITVKGDSESSLRTISQSTNGTNIFTNSGNTGWNFENFILQNTGASHGGVGLSGFGSLSVRNCIIGDVTNTLATGISMGSGALRLIGSAIGNCTTAGISGTLSNIATRIMTSWIHDCATGITVNSNNGPINIIDSIVEGNTNEGFKDTGNGAATGTIVGHLIQQSTFDGNGSHAISFTGTTLPAAAVFIRNNTFSNNGGWAITSTNDSRASTMRINNNGYFNNTSGNVNTSVLNADAAAITGDPNYVNRSGNDFTVQAAAYKNTAVPAGGTTTIGAGQSATYLYRDVGAGRHADPTGGGSLLKPGGMTGGMQNT